MRAALLRGSTPLFLRIFGVMLLTVFLVQLMNFVTVLLVPPPEPAVTTVTQIVGQLQGTEAADDALRLHDEAIAEPAAPGNRDRALRRLIAQRLAVPQSAVRVQSRGPGIGPGGPNGLPSMLSQGRPMAVRGPEPSGPQFEPPREERGELVVIGDFAASALIDGRWRTVELQSGRFAPWRRRTLLWLAAAMFVVAPFAWLLARRLARPIGLFGDAARRLGRNPKSPPLDLIGPPEIQDAAAAFNEMQARLNRYVEDRTTLMAAIAHDLRTPLMRLGLRLEHVPQDVQKACETDIRDMEQMIEAVMSFVRDMNRSTRRQKLDLRSLAQSVSDDFIDSGAAVTLVDGPSVIIEGDAPALKAMLSNLVGNAVKYAGNADVSLAQDDDMAIVEISDTGPGMSAEDLDRAFDPFFRAERSRNRDTGGIGLGLASVRAVARAHGGEATLTNRPGGGMLARVTLPF